MSKVRDILKGDKEKSPSYWTRWQKWSQSTFNSLLSNSINIGGWVTIDNVDALFQLMRFFFV
jgi:hypothetical protein